MEIKIQNNDASMTVALSGKLDTTTALELEKKLGALDGIEELLFDLNALDYISSAGLRTLLMFHKKMAERKGMKIENVKPAVMDIFKLTGFTKFLAIEN
jgi:anti-sigma B factor antagonist